MARQTLKVCVGKTIYLRNTSRMIHFMPMKEFFIENSLTFCHLFFLRALRMRHGGVSGTGLDDSELNRWMDGTAVKHLAETGAAILGLDAATERTRPFRVVEFYGYVGLTGEYLKLLLEQTQRDSLLDYVGCSPESTRQRFEVLHADDRHFASFVPDHSRGDDFLAELSSAADLVIYNHDEVVRRGVDPNIRLTDVIETIEAPVLIAARVSINPHTCHRTTIKGHVYDLPTADELTARLAATGKDWRMRLMPGFDEGYFLPLAPPQQDDEAIKAEARRPQTALVLAYRCPHETDVANYEAVTT